MAFQVDVADEEEYTKEVLKGAPGTLQVCEVYQSWCGPSKAVVSTFKRFALENPDNTSVKFYTVCASKVPGLAAKYDKCEPHFLFIKDGKVTEEVAGVQLPRITRLVQQLSNSMGVTQRSSSSSSSLED